MKITIAQDNVNTLEKAILRLKVVSKVSGNTVTLNNRGVEVNLPLTKVHNVRQGYTK